jgi:hypothetical protein
MHGSNTKNIYASKILSNFIIIQREENNARIKIKQYTCVENVEKTKYMLLSRLQNVGQNRDIKIANGSFENVSQFKYLGTTVTNQI